MPSIKDKRKVVMDYLDKFFNTLDPSGANAKLYHEKFDKMSDAQFDKAFTAFLNNDKANFYLEIVEYERDLKIEDIEKCADTMNVPLFERVAMPYLTGDKSNIIVTPEKVAVGYIHEKRMPQTLMKKSAASIKISKRNPKTGQVVGDDKNARNSDSEVYSLATLGANAALREFLGPRADDSKAKSEMYSKIGDNGFVSLDELTDDPYNKTAVNTFDVYFLMQGLRTNMIERIDKIPGPRERNYDA